MDRNYCSGLKSPNHRKYVREFFYMQKKSIYEEDNTESAELILRLQKKKKRKYNNIFKV